MIFKALKLYHTKQNSDSEQYFPKIQNAAV